MDEDQRANKARKLSANLLRLRFMQRNVTQNESESLQAQNESAPTDVDPESMKSESDPLIDEKWVSPNPPPSPSPEDPMEPIIVPHGELDPFPEKVEYKPSGRYKFYGRMAQGAKNAHNSDHQSPINTARIERIITSVKEEVVDGRRTWKILDQDSDDNDDDDHDDKSGDNRNHSKGGEDEKGDEDEQREDHEEEEGEADDEEKGTDFSVQGVRVNNIGVGVEDLVAASAAAREQRAKMPQSRKRNRYFSTTE